MLSLLSGSGNRRRVEQTKEPWLEPSRARTRECEINGSAKPLFLSISIPSFYGLRLCPFKLQSNRIIPRSPRYQYPPYFRYCLFVLLCLYCLGFRFYISEQGYFNSFLSKGYFAISFNFMLLCVSNCLGVRRFIYYT